MESSTESDDTVEVDVRYIKLARSRGPWPWLLMLGLLGLCLGLAIPRYYQVVGAQKLDQCRSQLKALAGASSQYATEHAGRFPDRLTDLVEGQYLSAMPHCPCQGDYQYLPRSDRMKPGFRIYCTGDHSWAYRGWKGEALNYPQYDSHLGPLDPP